MSYISSDTSKIIVITKAIKTTITKNFFSSNYIIMVSPTKNNQSHREDNNNIEETQKLFNALGSNFLKKERQNIRQKLYVKETIDKYLKELEEKG